MSLWDDQRDMDAEGQRAAIYHDSKDKGGHNAEFQVKNRPRPPSPTISSKPVDMPSREDVVAEIIRLARLLA